MGSLLLSVVVVPASAADCTDSRDVQAGAPGVRVCQDHNGNLLPDHVRAETGYGHAEYEEYEWCFDGAFCMRDTFVRGVVGTDGTYASAVVACDSWPLYWSFDCDRASAGAAHGDVTAQADGDVERGTVDFGDLEYENYDYGAGVRIADTYVDAEVDEYGVDGAGRAGDESFTFDLEESNGEVTFCRSFTTYGSAPVTGCDRVDPLP